MISYSSLKKQLSGQSYANLFRLSLLNEIEGLLVAEPGHLAGYGALGDGEPLCNIADP